MIGSMNGASKFSKTDGEEQQLGGIIYTKNLKLNQKIPEKIKEGRNNWLLMDKDQDYEDGDIGDTCDAVYEHINQMKSMEMPRDSLASMTKYFFCLDGETTTFFQEAVQILKARRGGDRPRKIQSAALFFTFLFLIRKRVDKINNESMT